MSTLPKLVIFDLDGVLVDTEWSTFLYYQNLLRDEYAILLPDSDFVYKKGRKSIDFFQDVLGAHYSEALVETLVSRKRKDFVENIQRYVTLIPGVYDTLKRLKDGGILIALGSQNERFFIDALLSEFSLLHFFATTVALQDVQKKKPDPEIFLLASSRVGISPKDAVVVEDSVEGIEAAQKGGFRVIGISPTQEGLKGVDLLLPSVKDLSLTHLLF